MSGVRSLVWWRNAMPRSRSSFREAILVTPVTTDNELQNE